MIGTKKSRVLEELFRSHRQAFFNKTRQTPQRSLTRVVLHYLQWDGLQVVGVDMLDGTPVLDIKPYLSNVPEGDLRRGWLGEAEARRGK